MANVHGIESMMILSAVPKVSTNIGTPDLQELDQVTMRELRGFQADGHFPPGSMGPKIDAALRFLEGGGERVIIAQLEQAMPALRGETGTHVVSDDG